MYTNNSLPTGRSDFHQDYCRNNCRWWNLCNTIHPLHHYAHHHTVSCRVLVSWKVYVEYKAVWGHTRRHCSVRTLCVYLCKNKSVVLTTQWSPWLHKSRRDMQWLLKTNCLRQPESQLLSSSYNHNTLTTPRTMTCEGVITNALQSCSNYKELPCSLMQSGDFLTDVLRVVSCCGCKVNRQLPLELPYAT